MKYQFTDIIYSGFAPSPNLPISFPNISKLTTNTLKSDIDETLRNSKLHIAALKGNVKSLLKEINSGIDINKINHEGQTPLHIATLYKQMQVIEQLIYHGASTKIRNKEGHTARDQLSQYPDIQVKFDTFVKTLSTHNISVIKNIITDNNSHLPTLPNVIIELIAEFIGGTEPWLQASSNSNETLLVGESSYCCAVS